MTSSDERHDAERKDPIELEPASPTEIRSDVQRVQAEWSGGRGPIPERPLHLCPYCDYNLTGLTHWRCPECGEPFTPSEARARGYDFSKDVQRARRSAQFDRAALVLGLAMMMLGSLWPCISLNSTTGSLQFSATCRGVMMFIYTVFGTCVACVVVNVYFDFRWSRIFFGAGLLILVFGLLVALL